MGGIKEHFFGDTPAHFDGATFDYNRDAVRLTGQLKAVYELLSNGEWYTLKRLAYLADGTEASVSARLRDLRKQRFGGHKIDRRHVANGLHEYKMRQGS